MAKTDDIWGKVHTTYPGILIFAHVAEPGAAAKKDGSQKNTSRYSATLIQKPNPRTDELIREIEEIGLKRFGSKFATSDAAFRPFSHGETVLRKIRESAQERGETNKPSEQTIQLYQGKIRLQANSSAEKEPPACYVAVPGEKVPQKLIRRPGVSEDVKRIQEQFYDGCWCTLAVSPYTYRNSDLSWGVTLLLRGIKFLRDGNRIGAPDLDAVFAQEEEVPEDAYMDEMEAAFTEEGPASAENI